MQKYNKSCTTKPWARKKTASHADSTHWEPDGIPRNASHRKLLIELHHQRMGRFIQSFATNGRLPA